MRGTLGWLLGGLLPKPGRLLLESSQKTIGSLGPHNLSLVLLVAATLLFGVPKIDAGQNTRQKKPKNSPNAIHIAVQNNPKMGPKLGQIGSQKKPKQHPSWNTNWAQTRLSPDPEMGTDQARIGPSPGLNKAGGPAAGLRKASTIHLSEPRRKSVGGVVVPIKGGNPVLLVVSFQVQEEHK